MPDHALSGCSLSLRTCGLWAQTTFMYGVIIAKRLILRLWKSGEAPTLKEMLSVLTELLHMERLRYDMMDKLKIFQNIWQPFSDLLAQ